MIENTEQHAALTVAFGQLDVAFMVLRRTSMFLRKQGLGEFAISVRKKQVELQEIMDDWMNEIQAYTAENEGEANGQSGNQSE